MLLEPVLTEHFDCVPPVALSMSIILNPDIRSFLPDASHPKVKLQPEGKYACITFDDNVYQKGKYYAILADFIAKEDLKPEGDFVEEWIIPRVQEGMESTNEFTGKTLYLYDEHDQKTGYIFWDSDKLEVVRNETKLEVFFTMISPREGIFCWIILNAMKMPNQLPS